MTIKTQKKSASSLDRIAKAIDAINNPQTNQTTSFKDDRYWQPEVDKAGNGFAVIRFLDAPVIDGEDALPFVRMFSYGFQGPTGSWYIENSLTTINQKDPVSEMNNVLWNTGLESDKKLARERKRRQHFISNILVIKDTKHPENEGKVFLYKYGKKIFNKINEQLSPGLDDEGNPIPGEEDKEPINIFDFYEGANFNLKIRNVEGYRNYDKSSFDAPSALDDKIIERVKKESYSLLELVSKDKFKAYDELKSRLDAVLGGNVPTATKTTESKPWNDKELVTEVNPVTDIDVDDEDVMAMFKAAAEDA